MSTNASEPAYPANLRDFQPDTGAEVTRVQYFGLSKRELIAAMIAQGLAANPEWTSYSAGDRPDSCQRAASCAIERADSLLAELAKPSKASP